MRRSKSSKQQAELEFEEPHVIRQVRNREVAEKQRRRNRLKRLVRLTFFFTSVTAVTGAMAGVTSWLTTSDNFATNVVKVAGNRRASAEDLVDLAGGARPGNIFLLDLAAIRDRLMSHNWVRDASVTRILPRTLEIRIYERTPVAVAVFGKGSWLVDGSGAELEAYEYGGAELDLPFISGMRAGSEKAELALGLKVLGALAAADRDVVRRISEINCEGESARVVFEDATPALVLGESRFVERVEFFRSIEKDLRARFAQIDYVDLRFTPRVYIKGEFVVAEPAAEGPQGSA